MIDHWDDVKKADAADDLCFGTVESWIVYVRPPLSLALRRTLTARTASDRRSQGRRARH